MKNRSAWKLPVIITGSILLIVIAVFLISDIVIVNAYNQQDHVVDIKDCYTDTAALENCFPAFGVIKASFWDSGILNKETLLVSLVNIGPSQYWLNGYFVIDPDVMDRIIKEYGLTGVSDLVNQHCLVIKDQITFSVTPQWMMSDELNTAFGGYFGEFYLDKANGIVIFDFVRD